ncbi:MULTISPECIES: LysR family transcriptional regulator [Herbaspirillum]|uniref:LysR family transcriptional regulator n=1 Tax=Herbaspirillum frisingense GSF30 TaxID=864073 RepID=A0AAI9N4J7_9BURK|nr:MULTISPECIES: LysR family transcriptional regulator [Herbaspirillum]EOA05364.1 LysR family transcriptional regulator [Herbaspirillum frisingense GSF30]ONN63859.1 LysR family transcriptional regulator [Herbaspirillum sp. VT-16-41]
MIRLDFDERDLRSLRVFCNVAEAGGFAAAERVLLMSKASISRHVREVEERLGVRLCERGPAGFRLTPEGEVALKLATTALRSLERIRPEIDAVHGVLSGPLALGVVEHALSHPDCKLPQAIAALKRRAPQVQPRIEVMTFPELNQALREQRVDIAIRGRYPGDDEFDYLPLFVESHRLYGAVRKEGGEPRKAVWPLVYRPHPYVDQVLAGDGYERGPEAGGLEAIALLVASGDYVGLLPTHYAQLIGKRYALRARRASPTFVHPICAVTDPHRPSTHRAELFLSLLRELHIRSAAHLSS